MEAPLAAHPAHNPVPPGAEGQNPPAPACESSQCTLGCQAAPTKRLQAVTKPCCGVTKPCCCAGMVPGAYLAVVTLHMVVFVHWHHPNGLLGALLGKQREGKSRLVRGVFPVFCQCPAYHSGEPFPCDIPSPSAEQSSVTAEALVPGAQHCTALLVLLFSSSVGVSHS